jgi:hypothetical protein
VPSAHGIDLLGDFHGAELAGDAGRVTAGHHESGEHRAKLTDHGDGDERAGAAHLAVLGQGAGHLQGHHRAAEEAGENHDGQAADTDQIHLHDDVVPVVRAGGHVADGPPGKQKEILNGDERFF